VTSPTGAVIRDILHRLSDRFPRHVLVWPVRVQGEGAAEEIAAAIRGFNELGDGVIPRPDLLIVARGGGSIEDLWSFNEEIVVRAAADSMIPLISAVGHETDVTLIDFVADRRAPTPTAAAEMAVPVRIELIDRIDSLVRRSLSSWARAHDHRRTELRAAVRALPSADMLLAVPRQRLDASADRLPRALIANARAHHAAYTRVASRLTPHTLRIPILRSRERVQGLAARGGQCMRVHGERRRDRFTAVAARLSAGLRANAEAQRARIARSRERIETLSARAARAAATLIDRRQARLERAGQLLTALSYHGVLARGFALVRAGGQPLRTAAAVSPGLRLDIEFADGHIGATAGGAGTGGATPERATGGVVPGGARPAAERSAADPVRPKLRRGDNPGQGSLF
jgi:exodeoxyribonuclease VII large subunit